MKYDSAGIPVWRARVTASNNSASRDITMDANNIYVTGTYSDGATIYNGVNVINPGTETTAGTLSISNQDGYQGYLCKTDKNEKGTVYSFGTYQKGDTIWINFQNCN